jgi:hypothetical protein
MVKGKTMIKVKNPNQFNIFDPLDFLTPERSTMRDISWPVYSESVFCHQFLAIKLPSILMKLMASRPKSFTP